jgi:hypothetical protein
MPMEKKVKTPEEKAFNKLFNKKMKLSPSYHLLSKDVGKAPKCGVREKSVSVAIATTPNKKKK